MLNIGGRLGTFRAIQHNAKLEMCRKTGHMNHQVQFADFEHEGSVGNRWQIINSALIDAQIIVHVRSKYPQQKSFVVRKLL